jgi:hypothetical protein
VLLLAVVDCALCQLQPHSPEGFRTDWDAISKDVVRNDILSKLTKS